MSRTAWVVFLLTMVSTAALADEKPRVRSTTRFTPDTWSTADRTHDAHGRLRARTVRVDTTGEYGIDDGVVKQRREVMRKDGSVKREAVSYAEQSGNRASMSKTIAWRRKDGSIRFSLGVGAGFGGGYRFHLGTRFGTIGKIPARALPRAKRSPRR